MLAFDVRHDPTIVDRDRIVSLTLLLETTNLHLHLMT